jgi:alpha-tubulin suppressor-like RCC1 family protein
MLMDATVHCWGDGADGRLGTGNTDDKTSPEASILFNTGSANVQLFALGTNTYVYIS